MTTLAKAEEFRPPLYLQLLFLFVVTPLFLGGGFLLGDSGFQSGLGWLLFAASIVGTVALGYLVLVHLASQQRERQAAGRRAPH